MLKLGERFIPAVVVKTLDPNRVQAVADKVANANKGKPKDFVPYEDDEVALFSPLSTETEFVSASGLGPKVRMTYFTMVANREVERESFGYISGIAMATSMTEAVKVALYNKGILDARGMGARLAEVNRVLSSLNVEMGTAVQYPVRVWDLDRGEAICAADAASSGLPCHAVDPSTFAKLDAACGGPVSSNLPASLSFAIHASSADAFTRVDDVDAERIVNAGRRLIGMPVHLMIALARGNEQADYVSLYGRIAGITETLVKSTGLDAPVLSVADLFMDSKEALTQVLGREVEDPEFALEVNRGNIAMYLIDGDDSIKRFVLDGSADMTVTNRVLNAVWSGRSARYKLESEVDFTVPSNVSQSFKDCREYLNLVYALYSGFSKKSPFVRVSPGVLQWFGINLGRAGGIFTP